MESYELVKNFRPMKKLKYKILLIFISVFIISFTTSSCTKRGYGCPGDKAGIKLDKHGNLPTKRGKSQLFNKKTRKRIKTHKRK